MRRSMAVPGRGAGGSAKDLPGWVMCEVVLSVAVDEADRSANRVLIAGEAQHPDDTNAGLG